MYFLFVSFNAQLHTIAFDALAYFSGELGADSFLPPGKVSDYFGFQYFRDVDEGELGHNTQFLTRIADNIFCILNDDQISQMKSLAEEQRELIESLVDLQRDELLEIVETRRAIATELRQFMTENGVDEDKVMELSRKYGELDGELVHAYATHFAEVSKTLTDEQMDLFMELRNLDGYVVKGAFLFSEEIEMPDIINTDFLFE